MALFRALETASRRPDRLVHDPWAAGFLPPALRAVTAAARVRRGERLVTGFIDRRWPGPRASAVVRTAWIDERVRAALRSGARHLVLVGAGYDTRGLRLAGSAVTTWELDHPVTQAIKRKVVAGADSAIRYIPIDFEQDGLDAALDRAGFPRGEPACFVWEGVLSYLTRPAIETTLDAIASAPAGGSAVLLTYVDRRAIGNLSIPWVAAVHRAGEPFVSGLLPAEAPAFFSAHGLEVLDDVSTRALAPAAATGIPDIYRLAELRTRPVTDPARSST